MNFAANGDFKSRNATKGGSSYVNPFVHKLELENPIDIIKTYVLTVVLLPFRIICICLCLILAWIFASVGLYGLSEEDLKTKPITGWRKIMQDLAAAAMRVLFVAGSFNYIKYKGVQASPKEAPILCVAPHSTYVDAIVVVVLGPPSIVAKAETSQLPFFGISTLGIWTYLAGGVAMITRGKQAPREEAPILVVAPHSSFLDSCVVYVTNLPSVSVRKESMDNKWAGKLINFTQPIYVLREDPNSRQNSIKEIVYRANSKEEWPQIVIFPEGTCTNRSALITFKPGAFYPGVPVQPVLLRYPNKLDTFTWTWEGPGALKLLWLTLTQIHSACEIEFLPVYKPSDEEKANPKLYAKNVRDVMAKALGVPVSDFTYDDCIIMTNAKEMNVPFSADIVEIDRLRKLLGLNQTNVEESILSDYSNEVGNYLTLQEFAEKLKISPNNTLTEQLFSILDTSKNNTVYLRDYLLCALFLIKQDGTIMDFLSFVAKIYGYSNRNLSKHELYLILKHTGKISREESDLLYIQIGSRTGGYVTFDEFSRHVQQKHEYSYLTTGGKIKKQ